MFLPKPLLVSASIVVLLSGCGSGEPVRPPVVLVVLDTLRADHTSLYGYERKTTPRLEALAAEASVFEHAYSAAAWTLPGVGSILTGQWPSVHGGGERGDAAFNRIREEVPTLAEVLSRDGYATGAVANGGYMAPLFGMSRGFDDYDFRRGADHYVRRADVNVDLALEWIDEHRDGPFFFMLHLFDIHRHYDAPEPVRGMFTEAYADDYPEGSLATLESRVLAEEQGDLDFHVAAYDEEIRWVDREVGRFMDALEERGLREGTIVAVVSDHGEAFFEHGAKGHGSSLHDEVINVPMLLSGPEIPAGRWQEPASTVDLVPTILEAAGIELPMPTSGTSLLPVMRGDELPERVLFAQNRFYGTDLVAVIDWPYKLIRDFGAGETLLYDLASDPGETLNLAPPEPGPLRQRFRQMRERARDARLGKVGADVVLDEETLEELRSLGYIR